jgi:hypothetical protein
MKYNVNYTLLYMFVTGECRQVLSSVVIRVKRFTVLNRCSLDSSALTI